MEVDLPVEYKACLDRLVKLQQIKEGSPYDPSTTAELAAALLQAKSENSSAMDFQTRHYVQQIIGGR